MDTPELTIQQLADLAGVSRRTLRHYYQCGLLLPAKINRSGYRIYGQREIDRLREILILRELDMSLDEIAGVLDEGQGSKRLAAHRRRIDQRISRLLRIRDSLDASLAEGMRKTKMSNKEKFSVFVEKMITENEQKYGEQARSLYGDQVVDASNAQLRESGEKGARQIEELSAELLRLLPKAMATGDPASNEARQIAEMHKDFVSFWWKEYREDGHRGLVDMYLQDPRFTAYYDDAAGKGAAAFLRDAVYALLEEKP